MRKIILLAFPLIISISGCRPGITKGTFHSDSVVRSTNSSNIWSGSTSEYTFLIDTTGDDIWDMTITIYGDQTEKYLSKNPKIQNIEIKRSRMGATDVVITP